MKSKLDKVYEISKRFRYEIYLVIISVFALAVHIHLASTLNLGNDEAHYYVWSLKPSLGYLDDAPLVSWVIYVFTGLFGKSQLSVRLGAVIFSFLDGFLIYYLTYILFKSKRGAFFAFLFFLSTVIFGMVLSVMILPDSPLLFFTLCFLIVFYKAVNSEKTRMVTDEKKVSAKLVSELNSDTNFGYASPLFLWFFSGLFLGFAFLSKYTAALIPPSALLYLAVSKKNRRLLKTFYPYMALGIAILVFLPVIYWNLTHNFISFRFQLSHGFSHPKPGFPLFMVGWLGQVLVITPFVYFFLFAAFAHLFYLRKKKKRKKVSEFKNKKVSELNSDTFLFSACLSLPILLFFIFNGYSHRILVHWPDIGYLSAFPVIGYAADLLTGKEEWKRNEDCNAGNNSGGNNGGGDNGGVGIGFLPRLWNVFVKYYIYFAIFFGFFLSFVLYNQIYYNSIPVGKIIKYIDKQKRLKKGGIFTLIPHIPGKPQTADITKDLFGWRRGAKYIRIVYRGYKAVYGPLFIMTHHYAIADELVYYGRFNPAVNIYNISGFLNQYDLWQNLNKINGKNALFVMDNKYMINPVKTYKKDFKSIKEIGRLDIYVKFRPVRVYYLYLMKYFNAKRVIGRLAKKSRMY